eukprot:TRINITY_DN10313_c0_g1_i1.p1 TRINITY_DN10313_c0_g1~~TRINITY_DN10313_c0_g1_i1.p1  ORF type:complete len:610 (-),score=199.14 TRINITY_DN10313_c0_g1_i1:25-1854(-)
MLIARNLKRRKLIKPHKIGSIAGHSMVNNIASANNGFCSVLKMVNVNCLTPTVPFRMVRFYSVDNTPHESLEMPALSSTMETGVVKEWFKKVGDFVDVGEPVASVETDKAVMDFESPAEGYVAKINTSESAMAIGSSIAILVENESDIEKFKDYSFDGKQESSPKKEEPKEVKSEENEEEQEEASSNEPSVPYVVVDLPALSPTMEEGKVAQFLLKPGDKINPEDSIAEIETDKAVLPVTATDEGYFVRALIGENESVAIGTPIAIIAENEEDIEALKDFNPSAPKAKKSTSKPEQKAQKEDKPTTKSVAQKSSNGRVFASPLARKLAREEGYDISDISGTGPNNRIIKADIEEYVPEKESKDEKKVQGVAKTDVVGDFEDITVENVRRVTAERLTFSKQNIPHYYLTIDCNVDNLMKIRSQLNEQSNGEYKLSVNDFVVKASALAMKTVPTVNSEWRGDVIRRYNDVHINVAVNTDRGLFTPVVRNAHTKGLVNIGEDVKLLAGKAKDYKLTPNELEGGTFTVSNLGMFGIKSFSAVINPPQSAILAVSGIEEKPVLSKDQYGNNNWKLSKTLTVTLSCDHRVIDGAVGAQWLQKFKELMEDPVKFIL